MRIALDTEFYEDGKTIELISIGLVNEFGATYYAEVQGAGLICEKSEWLMENVFPHLTGPRKSRSQIAQEIYEFADLDPEFWGWYSDYDWVVLCQLFGRMIDLPPTFPMYCRDLRQVVPEGTPMPAMDLELDGPEHHALSDAKWLNRMLDVHHIN